MLHVILSLLKIIVFFILILLGILLLLIIAVLAAPVTYDFSGEWAGKPCLRGRIHWLYHIVGVSVHMKGTQPEVQFSIFGHVPGSGKKQRRGRSAQMSCEESVDTDRDIGGREEDTEEKNSESSYNATDIIDEPVINETAEMSDDSETGDTAGTDAGSEISDTAEADGEPEISDTAEIEKALNEDLEKEALEETDRDILAMIRQGVDFFSQPPVRKLLSGLWGSIRRIIRHLRPSRFWIQARIGMDDPALTGKIMELAAILYAFYYENIEIVSEFDEKVLEGRFSVRGWLVPGYLIIKLLGMALRILLNKECRTFYREIKESLT